MNTIQMRMDTLQMHPFLRLPVNVLASIACSSRVLDHACANVVSDQFKADPMLILSKIAKQISRHPALLAKQLMELVTARHLN
jgi:hypothetical protein